MRKEKKIKEKKVKERQIKLKQEKKSETYRLREDSIMRILRACFWIMLLFFFFKGIQASIKPDSMTEATDYIANFKKEFSEYKDENEEVLGFAQNFAKEYLTYSKDEGQSGYLSRMAPYISDKVRTAVSNSDIKGDAAAVYVAAYRKEEYAPDQYDVYIQAEVEYEIRQLLEDGSSYGTRRQSERTTLKVPVCVTNGTYIIEDVPVFVSDSMKTADYEAITYSGVQLSDAVTQNIQGSVQNFLRAYCEQNQSVIEYYLAKNADRSKFYGLNGRYGFDSIAGMKCYQEEGSSDIRCIVTYFILDGVNGNKVYQGCNMTVISEGGRYYIKDMDARTVNLSF